jgi:hypothetical protein
MCLDDATASMAISDIFLAFHFHREHKKALVSFHSEPIFEMALYRCFLRMTGRAAHFQGRKDTMDIQRKQHMWRVGDRAQLLVRVKASLRAAVAETAAVHIVDCQYLLLHQGSELEKHVDVALVHMQM